MSTVDQAATAASPTREWAVPVLLVLLSAVPVIAGAFRVGELAAGAPVTAENARFFAAPVPLVLHIVAAIPYCLLGAFQFVPRLRRRRWHRVSGRLLVPLGLTAALTGVWMTLLYDVPAIDTGPVAAIRLVVGAAMAVFIVLGVLAVRRGDIARHSAWMIRAYALGQGAGTQVFTHLPWMLAGAEFDQPARTLAMGAGWAVNAVVAEWAIRRMRRRPPR
ncbi:DUF2306 domain-containing protein [Nocardiopsis sp. RSe5-2]|uniref:DUF2306 domain-containing protein n=1 Tax=Nocardiopsis endophytica TaxID=3018445 RepID=A0ABT4UDD8_9ACTN|nr:DUF2306 domain-containing protein [Nocardiopsis endophytica]MDA2814998.1 DUF2306 domain-containing protein [Nocardiopsis endophytica]